MKPRHEYYYDHQIYRYILQFMAIFSVMKVEIGKRNDREAQLINIPIHYSSQDRVTHAITARNVQNTPISLPAMSVYMRNINLSPELRKGVGVEKRSAFVPVGGLLPDDVKVVHQRQPVPYKLTLELGIYVSNLDQHLQVLEQILSLFDPVLTIQTSDGVFDMTKITSVELVSINVSDLLMHEQDKRVIQSTLTFDIPIYLEVPSDVRNDVVKKIIARVGMVNQGTSLSEDIIVELDNENFDYHTIVSADDIPFQ